MGSFTPEEITAIWLSVKVACWATAVSLVPGILVAWLLARRSFPGRILLDGLVHLPLVLPPVVTGYILLLLFGRNGPVGRILADMGIVLAFNWTGAVLACSVMAFPLLVRAIRLSMEAVDTRLEGAAAGLGAPPWAVFLTVTLPLSLPGILSGAILCFAKALGEFGATITFVAAIPGVTQTLPAAIYGLTQVPGGDAAALRLTMVAAFIAIVALTASELLARRVRRRVEGRDA
ncbi:molybdate ABC transporter permease subunit [Niveispirillum sp.]|uniref:molybdate ABC transporter permease subunit n=1 Tax=Niveispirillum sp. TaxID=1917217 RepID=UPI001B7B73E9|nr:molybdate ABC transporter permease subunit [Niveispirillum sp.]MBP7339796.1 molybdate ABC transporter permease subunit [Niveispirillum sp.]